MKMSKKNFLRITSAILATVILYASLCVSALAIDTGYTFVGSKDVEEDRILWIPGTGTKYTYKVYQDPTWARAFYPNDSICYPVYHVCNNSMLQLTYSKSISFSAQTGAEFSNSIGLQVGIDSLLSLVSELAGTFSVASGMTITNTGGVAVTISSDAPTGYYSMVPAINFRRYEIDKMLQGSTNVIRSDYLYGIIKDTYLMVIYDTSNTNNHSYHVYG